MALDICKQRLPIFEQLAQGSAQSIFEKDSLSYDFLKHIMQRLKPAKQDSRAREMDRNLYMKACTLMYTSFKIDICSRFSQRDICFAFFYVALVHLSNGGKESYHVTQDSFKDVGGMLLERKHVVDEIMSYIVSSTNSQRTD